MLLPNEETLIFTNPNLIEKFLKHEEGFYYLDMNTDCPYFQEEGSSGECKIYNDRPIDCRIFPFFPKFDLSNNKYVLYRSEWYCPINVDSINKMKQCVKSVLDIVNDNVSYNWKKTYNCLNYKRFKNQFRTLDNKISICQSNKV
jgi:Fe-S-cluster containining protein